MCCPCTSARPGKDEAADPEHETSGIVCSFFFCHLSCLQIDTRPPETMGLDHVRNNLKRELPLAFAVCKASQGATAGREALAPRRLKLLQLRRYHAIDRDNRILLQKMLVAKIESDRSYEL